MRSRLEPGALGGHYRIALVSPAAGREREAHRKDALVVRVAPDGHAGEVLAPAAADHARHPESMIAEARGFDLRIALTANELHANRVVLEVEHRAVEGGVDDGGGGQS